MGISRRKMVELALIVTLPMVYCLLSLTAIASAAGAGPSAGPVPANTALQRLLEGNQRYVNNAAQHPDQRPSADPQHPIAAILSCADSRVPPEIIFDQGIGSLFVTRVAGNTYTALVLESLEYAVQHLGVRLIVVMGHDQCGAVRAAIDAYPERMAGVMLKNIYPAVKAAKHMSGDTLTNTINANAELAAKGLAAEAPFAPLVRTGELKIMAARYGLASGRVIVLPNDNQPGDAD
jgi:carbonic anhydrase